MKNIILTLLSFFGAVILFFIALLYAQMDVGIKNIHYDLLIEEAFMMSLKLHFIILPIHFLISRRKWERYFKKYFKTVKILVFRFLKNWAHLCIFNDTYIKQAAMGTGVSVTAQYSVNEEINYNDVIKSGFMAPYMLLRLV